MHTFKRGIFAINPQTISKYTAEIILAFGLAAISVHAQALPPDYYAPLDSWSFSYGIWDSDYGYPPASYTNIVSVFGESTDALLIDSTNAAHLQYNVFEEDGAINLTVDQGSVAFWFSPDWTSTNLSGTGPGNWGRLIEVGSYTTNASSGWWSLYLDPEGANLYFSAQTNGAAADYLAVPISWNSNEWHHVALTYSTTNSALYLDGALITNGLPVTVWPGLDVLTNGFYLGSDSNGILQARGKFDDLSTYAGPLDAGAVHDLCELYSIAYGGSIAFASFSSAPSSSTNVPTFQAITGSGYLQLVGSAGGCITSTNVWITNVVCTLTNPGVNVTFTIAGGSNGVPYDVFATSAIAPLGSTNRQWAWMGQGYKCNTYVLTNLPSMSAFLILGFPQDSDQDGLTDAYERLVSNTNPNNPDTSGDGMLDGWKVLWGLNPGTNNPAQPGQRSNYTYDSVGWLEGISGIRSGGINLDFEGNVTQSSQ